MATSLRLLRLNVPFMFNSMLRNTLSGTFSSGVKRSLFTNKSIGLNNYEYVRTQTHQQFINIEDSFRSKMKEIVNNENSTIFTEDLKAMSHLVTNNSDDIDLFVKMIYKFNNQSNDLRFSNYSFGPVVMRAFFYLNKPDIALSSFLDPKLTSFFDQTMSYAVLLTLLYNHQMYSQVRQVFEIYVSKIVNTRHFARIPIVVNAAACYRENTPESFNFLLNTWKEISNCNFPPLRRVISLLSGLAINQNSPEVALELLTLLRSNYIENRSLKVLAFTKLNRFADVSYILRYSLEGSYSTKETYFSDVIKYIEEQVEGKTDENSTTLMKLISLMKAQGHIDEMTLESHLIQPIDFVFPKKADNRTKYDKDESLTPERRRIIGLKDLI
ncbi:hypothetical protein M0802_003613 [Mischocyttarus mexicanus]|nr:hypothetical protein M0802_003613 [Mischocyttarus mexicanus]